MEMQTFEYEGYIWTIIQYCKDGSIIAERDNRKVVWWISAEKVKEKNIWGRVR